MGKWRLQPTQQAGEVGKDLSDGSRTSTGSVGLSILTFSFQHFHPTTSILDFHNIFPNSLWLHSHRIFHLGFFIPRYPYQNFYHHFNTRFHLIFSITRFWVRGPRAARQWPAPLKQLQLSWTRCRKPTSGFIWELNLLLQFYNRNPLV